MLTTAKNAERDVAGDGEEVGLGAGDGAVAAGF